MKQLKDALVYRGVATPPGSTLALMRRLGPFPENSVSAMLRAAGPFVASRDAYHFSNSPGQAFTAEDAAIVRQHFQGLVDQVSLIGIAMLRAALTAFSFSVPVAGPTGLPAAAVDYVINQVTGDLRNKLVDSIVASVPGHYGRCGGMAFSCYDFFLAGWSIPPDTVQPGSGVLRDYIWSRLLDSLQLNAATFLEWTMVLHILPDISKLASAALGAAAGGVIGGPAGAALGSLVAGKDDVLGVGGAHGLIDRTRNHWGQLKAHLDRAAGWPAGIIHGGSANPTDQHQVLAIGYHDFGNGTATLDIWDNNDLGICRRLQLAMQGSELSVSSSNTELNDTKGIICEEYSWKVPPQALQHSSDGPSASKWSPAQCA
jgi:hypothetical protein